MNGRIYFDVDGVFNAVTRKTPEWGWERESRKKVNGWPICWSPDLVDAINAVAATPEVECYWLTTWCDDAPTILAPALGIDGADWPVVGYEHWRRGRPEVWWKLPAIQEHLGDFEGPVLWIDDDLRFDAAAQAWLLGQPQILTVCPNSGRGITRDEAEIVRRFASEACAEDVVA